MKRRTNKDLKQIAIDMVDGKIFTDQQIRSENNIPMVFMPIMMGCFSKTPKRKLMNIGLVFEYLSEYTCPRSINGMPIFFSLKTLTKWEVSVVDKYIKEYRQVKEQFQST